MDVEIRFTDGTHETLYDVQWTEMDRNSMTVCFWAKKYPSLGGDSTKVHLGTFPVVNIQKWKVTKE